MPIYRIWSDTLWRNSFMRLLRGSVKPANCAVRTSCSYLSKIEPEVNSHKKLSPKSVSFQSRKVSNNPFLRNYVVFYTIHQVCIRIGANDARTTYCIDLTGQVFSNTGFSYINRYRMLLSQKNVFLKSTGFGMIHFDEILFCDCSCVPSSRIIAPCIIMSMHYPKSMQELTRRKN